MSKILVTYDNYWKYLDAKDFNKMSYGEFTETISWYANDAKILKEAEKHVTHLKLVYVRHLLTNLAAKRLINGALNK